MSLYSANAGTEKAPNYKVLPGGTYGPGLANEANVELTEFVVPNAEGKLTVGAGFDVAPGFDKEMTEGPYWYWNFKVITAEGTTAFVRAFTGEKTGRKWLKAAGVAVADDPNDPNIFSFDPDEVAPRTIEGGVELKPSRTVTKDGEEKTYAGDVKTVFSA